MVEIVNLGDNSYYYPPEQWEGLERLIRFPDSEIKHNSIPNSTIWVFNSADHIYVNDILSNDVGCGMALFLLSKVDPKISADKICSYLMNKNILGRGNHFVDICTPILSQYEDYKGNHNLMLLHTDGKSYDPEIPKNIREAASKQRNAEKFRNELGHDLCDIIGAKCHLIGDWTHNSVAEESGKIIYRKGVIKIKPGKIHILSSHIGSTILAYLIDKRHIPPYNSMPHATGRAGPRGDMKVSVEEAKKLRKFAYIPEMISNESLRTEYITCYNYIDAISKSLNDSIIPVGDIRILSYVGKV